MSPWCSSKLVCVLNQQPRSCTLHEIHPKTATQEHAVYARPLEQITINSHCFIIMFNCYTSVNVFQQRLTPILRIASYGALIISSERIKKGNSVSPTCVFIGFQR